MRRWARINKKSLSVAYQRAAEKLGEAIGFFFVKGVVSVSVHGFSKDNLKRRPDELQPIYEAGAFLCTTVLRPLAQRWEASVRHAGPHALLGEKNQRAIDDLCETTANLNSRKIFLCIGYDPMDEILQALEAAPTASELWNYLWVPEKVDLVIRTGDAPLLSNFLPLQCGYARLCFIDKLFPDVDVHDMEKALTSFPLSGRLFGE